MDFGFTEEQEALRKSAREFLTDRSTTGLVRELMASKKYRARDIYPRLSPELQKLFEQWKKTHKKEGVKPNSGQ